MGFGEIAYLIPRGQRAEPPDLIIPSGLRESMPEGDLGRWRSGQPIHQVASFAIPVDWDLVRREI